MQFVGGNFIIYTLTDVAFSKNNLLTKICWFWPIFPLQMQARGGFSLRCGWVWLRFLHTYSYVSIFATLHRFWGHLKHPLIKVAPFYGIMCCVMIAAHIQNFIINHKKTIAEMYLPTRFTMLFLDRRTTESVTILSYKPSIYTASRRSKSLSVSEGNYETVLSVSGVSNESSSEKPFVEISVGSSVASHRPHSLCKLFPLLFKLFHHVLFVFMNYFSFTKAVCLFLTFCFKLHINVTKFLVSNVITIQLFVIDPS